MQYAVYLCISLGNNENQHRLRRFRDVLARDAYEAVEICKQLLEFVGLRMAYYGIGIYQMTQENSHFRELRVANDQRGKRAWACQKVYRRKKHDTTDEQPSEDHDLDSCEFVSYDDNDAEINRLRITAA